MLFTIHKMHHPHLKKRAALELIGLVLLFSFAYIERDTLVEAVRLVADVNAGWFIILLSAYWLVLPLTAFSYKLISPKPKKLKLGSTILAHLAGAGPGRIIPGGIGNISISALHLRRTGLTIEQAIGVIVTNNVIGLISNGGLLIVLTVVHPTIREILLNNVSRNDVVLLILSVTAIIVTLQWLAHVRAIGGEIKKTFVAWKKVFRAQLYQPRKLCLVVLLALLITFIHASMLDFSAYALGFEVALSDAIVALSLGVAIGGLLPTPGGLGGVEAGIIAALVALGYDAESSTSIAFLYRIATYGQPLLPGTLAYLYLRERKLL